MGVGVGLGAGVGVGVVRGTARWAVSEAMSFDWSASLVFWWVVVTPAVLVIRRESFARGAHSSGWVQGWRRSVGEVVATRRTEWVWLGWRGLIWQVTTSAVPVAGSPGARMAQSGELAWSKLSPMGSRSVTVVGGESAGPRFSTVRV